MTAAGSILQLVRPRRETIPATETPPALPAPLPLKSNLSPREMRDEMKKRNRRGNDPVEDGSENGSGPVSANDTRFRRPKTKSNDDGGDPGKRRNSIDGLRRNRNKRRRQRNQRKKEKNKNKREKRDAKHPKQIQGYSTTPRRRDLVFIEQSPDYCSSVVGRKGVADAADSAEARRYSRVCRDCGLRAEHTDVEESESCNCKFLWCCQVECQTCVVKKVQVTCLLPEKD